MHPSSRLLLRLRPLSGSEIAKESLKLSPQASKQVYAKRTTRETFNETAKQLLVNAESVGPRPENLRIEVADKKKTMYWRVSKPERQLLRKVLRET